MIIVSAPLVVSFYLLLFLFLVLLLLAFLGQDKTGNCRLRVFVSLRKDGQSFVYEEGGRKDGRRERRRRGERREGRKKKGMKKRSDIRY